MVRSISVPTGKYSFIVVQVEVVFTWEVPMDVGVTPHPNTFIGTSQQGNSTSHSVTWDDATHLRVKFVGLDNPPDFLHVRYLGGDPNLRTATGIVSQAWYLTDIPDPPWLLEAVGNWVSEHAPPPPPGDPAREAWFDELRQFILTKIREHEPEE